MGQAHYQGGCFVFDERAVLNADLKPGLKPGSTGHLSE